jgi:hypothetical protein
MGVVGGVVAAPPFTKTATWRTLAQWRQRQDSAVSSPVLVERSFTWVIKQSVPLLERTFSRRFAGNSTGSRHDQRRHLITLKRRPHRLKECGVEHVSLPHGYTRRCGKNGGPHGLKIHSKLSCVATPPHIGERERTKTTVSDTDKVNVASTL